MAGVLKNTEVFTTGQIARMVKVAPRTVTKWIDSGLLKGFRIPGGADRRVPRESLLQFFKMHGIPCPPELKQAPVLIVGFNDRGQNDAMRSLVTAAGRPSMITDNLFEAGVLIAEHHPDVLILDRAVGPKNLCASVGQAAVLHNPHARCVLVCTEDEEPWLPDHFSHSFRHPCDPVEVMGAALIEQEPVRYKSTRGSWQGGNRCN